MTPPLNLILTEIRQGRDDPVPKHGPTGHFKKNLLKTAEDALIPDEKPDFLFDYFQILTVKSQSFHCQGRVKSPKVFVTALSSAEARPDSSAIRPNRLSSMTSVTRALCPSASSVAL